MSQASLTFNLPEEKEDFLLAVKAGTVRSALEEFSRALRGKVKYGEQPDTTWEECRQLFWDVMRDYPDHPKERQHWADRVFYRPDSGAAIPVSHFITGREPSVVKHFSRLIRLVESRRVQGVLRFALSFDR